MKLLLDNCVDRNLAKHIQGHEVVAAFEIGWGALVNGQLLAQAAQRFQVLVSVDKNLRHQQNLAKLPLPVVEFDCVKNWVGELLKFLPYLDSALEKTAEFNFVSIKSDGKLECLAPRELKKKP